MEAGMHVTVDPNTTEDTEFNAILRQKGILPPLPKPEEESPGPSPETIRRNAAENMSYNKLTEKIERLEDEGQDEQDDDVKFLEMYRQKRLDELREAQKKARFGSYGEVTKSDWTTAITNAGPGIYVVVHLTEKGNEKCALVDQHMRTLAVRYPAVKFLRGEVSLCVPDFPQTNLPTVVVYLEGDVKMQYVGSKALGGHPCDLQDIEERLAKVGAIQFAVDVEENKKGPKMAINCIRNGGAGHRRTASDSDSD